MKKMKNCSIVTLFILLVLLWVQTGCKKNILDEKPSSTLVVPTTLDDMERLLGDINGTFSLSPEMGEISSDDYYIADLPSWQVFGKARARNCYLWKADIYEEEQQIPDWNIPYKQIYYCNNILEGIEKISIDETDRSKLESLKGRVYFLRAYAFYSLSQIFCNTYDASNSKSELGLPLKLKSDLGEKIHRSSLEETYTQIITDLKNAEKYTSSNPNLNQPNIPSKVTVYAMFARLYLSMGDYVKAALYADKSINLQPALMIFANLDSNSDYPFPVIPQAENPEIIYYDRFATNFQFASANPSIIPDSTLYKQYEEGDLRKEIYFRTLPNNRIGLKASYVGNINSFSGLSVDEMYLIRSESNARLGEVNKAMNDLNMLLKSRWAVNESTGQTLYVNKIAATPADALNIILTERRKELVFRGLRWTDIKRLNKEGYKINLKRILNGVEYLLPANDKRFVLPIPKDEILLSGIEQNDR